MTTTARADTQTASATSTAALSLGERATGPTYPSSHWYHGLRFDACGTCTWAPGQDRIPSRANVVTRPLVERSPWIFVWMGDPDERWAVVDGTPEVAET